MKRWLKVGAWVLLAVALIAFIGPRLYVKNANAHLTIDGRVTDDFKLYFGPGGRILLRIGAKQTTKVFFYSGNYTDGWADECPPSEFLFPPFVAIAKRGSSQCVKGER